MMKLLICLVIIVVTTSYQVTDEELSFYVKQMFQQNYVDIHSIVSSLSDLETEIDSLTRRLTPTLLDGGGQDSQTDSSTFIEELIQSNVTVNSAGLVVTSQEQSLLRQLIENKILWQQRQATIMQMQNTLDMKISRLKGEISSSFYSAAATVGND